MRGLYKLGFVKAKAYFIKVLSNLWGSCSLSKVITILDSFYFNVLDREEFIEFAVDFIGKLANFKDHYKYFEAVEIFFVKLHAYGGFVDIEPALQKIIHSFFLQIDILNTVPF